MRLLAKAIVWVFLVAAFTGCSMSSRLNAYVGNDFKEVKKKWGEPTSEQVQANGLTRESYLRRGSVHCDEYVFFVDQVGIVKGWSNQPVACPGVDISVEVRGAK